MLNVLCICSYCVYWAGYLFYKAYVLEDMNQEKDNRRKDCLVFTLYGHKLGGCVGLTTAGGSWRETWIEDRQWFLYELKSMECFVIGATMKSTGSAICFISQDSNTGEDTTRKQRKIVNCVLMSCHCELQ